MSAFSCVGSELDESKGEKCNKFCHSLAGESQMKGCSARWVTAGVSANGLCFDENGFPFGSYNIKRLPSDLPAPIYLSPQNTLPLLFSQVYLASLLITAKAFDKI